jgi:hypothetical protein
LRGIGVDQVLILKWIVNKFDKEKQNGFACHWTGTTEHGSEI